MKPTFALDFRNDAIALLHRTPRGWHLVGQVTLDAPDLDEALSYLRSTALGLSPRGLTTKLVIPNSQILYATVHAPAPEPQRRRKQVARALEGLTPYQIKDLAFSHAGDGPEVQVAVIARETLAEAEAFAVQHRFNPISFVAVPETGDFTGEPWFGATAFAASLLPPGQRVDRDAEPIVVPGREVPGREVPGREVPGREVPGREVRSGTDPDPMVPAVAEPDFFDVGPVAADVPAVQVPDPVFSAEPEPAAFASVPAMDDAREVADRRPYPEALPDRDVAAASAVLEQGPGADEPVVADRMATDPAGEPLPTAAPGPDDQDASAGPVAALNQASDRAAAAADEAPIALDVVDEEPALPAPRAPVVNVTDPSIPKDVPPPATSIMMAFASRRAAETSAQEVLAAKTPVRTPGTKSEAVKPAAAKPPILGSVTASRGGAAPQLSALAGRPAADTGQPRVVPPSGRPALSVVQANAIAEAARPTPAKGAAKPGPAAKALRGFGALVTAPGIPGTKQRRVAAQTTPVAGPNSAASAAAATLTRPAYSGGLGSRPLPTRGKPRFLGLILTGVLLVFLALIAAWSTFFIASREADGSTDVASAATDMPAPEDEMLADLQDPAELSAAPEAAAGTDPQAPADPAGLIVAEYAATDPAAEPVAEILPEPAPDPAPDTGITTDSANSLRPAADPQDEIFLAAMDAPPDMPDALSLPQPAVTRDAPPGPAVPPPPFGTVYQFDTAGNIVPTPEGIVTPEGVRVVAGRPSSVPPPRPAALVPPAAEVAAPDNQQAAVPDAAAAPGAGTGTDPAARSALAESTILGGVDVLPGTGSAVAPDLPAADPALAAARPRARPATLAPGPTLNADDDASLAPAAGSRFSSLRPRGRPPGLTPAVVEVAGPAADRGAQGASLVVLAAAAAPRSPFAVTVSRKPAARPRDLSRAVEAAVAAATRAPDPAPPSAGVAQPQEPQPQEPRRQQTEPEADNEPEVASAMPRLPTRASVAKQATFVNAINLSRVNLIGVYGSQSERHALIRQSNGRYKKVKVGDSFDGGRVSAITASELRYQKSGKMVTLALPKS